MTDALLFVARDIGKLGTLADSATKLIDELGGTVGNERVTAQEIVNNIERASRNMADAFEQIKEDPSLLLRGPGKNQEDSFE